MMPRPIVVDELPSADRWMVSWADFVTLLLAFFVVLYASSNVNPAKAGRVSEALGTAFGAPPPRPVAVEPLAAVPPPALPALPKESAQMNAIAEEIRTALGGLLSADQVRITQSERGVAIDINASLLFAPGEARLSPAANEALAAMAGVLAHATERIEVAGHTDSMPMHSAQFASNWELSAVRAASVVRRLLEGGVGQERLVAIGHASTQPLDSNDSAAGRARNRRVHVLIVAAGG